MKSISLRFLVAFVALALFFACATKKEEQQSEAAAEETEWKQMDDFHMIMAETFHPYKDSANLEPAKTRAAELAAAAKQWASEPLPKKVDNDEMKGKLSQLQNDASAFAETVASGDDKAIGEQLTKLHDTFHEIQEAWYGEGEEEGHDHH